MAFTRRSGNSVQVRQGNNNELLKTFSGPMAEKKAMAYVKELHMENHPMPSNRGQKAAAKFRSK